MDGLKIDYIPIKEITPYKNNAKRHPREQIEQIKKSIKEFGMNDPIAICGPENYIVEGHGRLIALRELGYDTAPVIRLDWLTDEQRRAYTLIHNKLTMNSDFDLKLLNIELENIIDINMNDFEFDLEMDGPEKETDSFSKKIRDNIFENQERMQFDIDNYYGIPSMTATQTYGENLVRFCDHNQIEDKSKYICHFYYDDFKFIQAWREPEAYIDTLREFKAVISPDFSLYTDFPRALQILSCYRRQWCGAYWQMLGIDVIPDVVWGDEESFAYCFEGIPKQSVVAVSSVGVTNDKEWNGKEGEMFKRGYDEMLKRLEPTKIIYYGTLIDGLEGDIIRVPSFYEIRRKGL